MQSAPLVILASASPRRAELLANIGVHFRVAAADIAEDVHPAESATETARRLAATKALAVAAREPDAVVIGADTLVVHQQAVMGKPRDAGEAAAMLRRLSGHTHQVITGVAVVSPSTQIAAGGRPMGGQVFIEHEVTDVEFRSLADTEIAAYVRSGEPMDKAGAYGIQGLASLFVPRIGGCYFNVVGLPVVRLAKLLRLCGVPLLE